MFIFLIILAIFLFGVVATVTISFALAWCENSLRHPHLLEERFKPGKLIFAAYLIILESACLLLTILLQPFGWFNHKTIPPRTLSDPVILLHGLFQSQACWLWMKPALRHRGFSTLYTMRLAPWKDIETLTAELGRQIDALLDITGRQHVHLVGHSMGGLIARNYLQFGSNSHKVDHCILLATPNKGSNLAPFALSPLGRLLVPGSAFLQKLATAPLPRNTRITAIYSRHDNLVVPYENACLEGTHNVELTGSGHMTLLFRPKMPSIVAGLLKEPIA